MRVYTHMDRFIQSTAIQDYTFIVITNQINDCQDWVVNAITYHDYNPVSKNKTILTLSLYYIGRGYKIIELVYRINVKTKLIILNFKVRNEGQQIPALQDTTQRFLTTVIAHAKQVNGKKYITNIRDMNRFIQKIQWEPQLPTLKQQRLLQQQRNPLIPFVSITLTLAIAIGSYLKFK